MSHHPKLPDVFADINDLIALFANAKRKTQIVSAIQMAFLRGLHKGSKIESQEMSNDYIRDPSAADVAADLVRIFKSEEFESVSGFGKIDVIEHARLASNNECCVNFVVGKRQFQLTVYG